MSCNTGPFASVVLSASVALLSVLLPATRGMGDDPRPSERPVIMRAVPIEDAASSALQPSLIIEEALDPDPEETGGTREGGETCATALTIAALPFSDTGDTRNNANDVESPDCEDAIQESRDVVYKYTPASNQIISISFCGTDSAGAGHDDTRLLVFAGNCNSGSEYACNNDSATSCSHDVARFAQAEIPALAVTGGVDYFIVVDGFGGDNGTYVINVAAVGNGACCKVVGGQTCTANVSPLACTCLAEKWTEGGSCATPDCTLDPVPASCPPNHLFGPGFEAVATTLWIIPADDFFPSTYADAFWNVDQPTQIVSWWGVYSIGPGIIATCDKPDLWSVTFYADQCGEPGDPIAGPFEVTAQREGTGFVFTNTSEIFRFTAALPVSVSLSTAWVGFSAKADPNAPTCAGRVLGYFSQPPAPGDAKSWFIGGASPLVTGDLLMCLAAPADPGACCNDQTGVCSDGVLPAACPPPSRFSEGELCAALDPACGQGACCTLDGNCALTNQAGCSGTWKPGVLCAFANCPPSNDNCALVIPDADGLPYVFTNRTNGATDDDCPALGAPAGWEAFVLADTQAGAAYSCYDLVVDYCGTTPAFVGDAADFLTEACCDLASQRASTSAGTTARVGACCRDEPPGYDGNLSLVFHGVPAGTWYYPVFSGGGSLGDYTLNVTGGAASPDNIGDVNGDGRKDLVDYADFVGCLMTGGPGPEALADICLCLIDGDQDSDVDLHDFAKFQAARTACTSCAGTAEGEPACAGVNDGCDAASPAFSAIACGQTVCGTSSTSDSDWYQIAVTQNTTLTWEVTAEFPANIAILDGNFGCHDAVDGLTLASADGAPCAPASITACVRGPGTYWVRVAPQAGETVACGSSYRGRLTCASPCTPAATGACCQANSACTPNALEASCIAAEGKYRGNGSTCPCPAPPAGDECLSAVALTCGPGTYTFSRSQLTSNASDPVNNCELNDGGPFAKDGSIWFKWNSGSFGIQRLHLDLCCEDGGPAGDSLITVFPGRTLNENPATACPAILALGDGQEIGCDDDSCVATGPGGADLCLLSGAGQPLTTNRTYYILVEIYDSGEVDEQESFTLNITCASCTARTCPTLPVCDVPVSCPPGAIQENENLQQPPPVPGYCADDYEDNYNAGCNPLSRVPPDPEAFAVSINCGNTVCGTAGYYNTTGGSATDRRRDTDWYRLILTEESLVTWVVESQSEGAHALLIDANDCDNAIVLLSSTDLDDDNDPAPGCGPVMVSGTVPAGRYAVFASFLDPAPAGGSGSSNEAIDCPKAYVGEVSCTRGDIMPTPENVCGDAPMLTGAGRYSGFVGAPVTQTPDGESSCDGDLGSAFCAGPEANDVFWTYQAPCTGKVSFEVRSGPAPIVLSGHSACPADCDNELPGGFGISCSSFGGGPGGALPKMTLDVRAGVTYVIRLAAGSNAGPYELVVSDCVTCCDPTPAPNCPICGNGQLEGGEECDDGDNTGGDGCDSFCRTE